MQIRNGTIQIKLALDGRRFDTDMRKAQQTSEAFAAQAGRRMGSARKSFDGVAKAAGLTGKEIQELEGRMKRGLAADSASRALDRVAKSAGLTRKEISQLEKQMGLTEKRMSQIGSVAGAMTKRLLAVGAAYASWRTVSGIITSTTRDFSEFETVLVDMGKVTDENRAKIEQMAMSMDRVYGDPTALVQGYYQTISAGITDAVEARETLTDAAKASKAAHVGLDETIEAGTKLIAAYKDEINGASDAFDFLFKVEKVGQTSFAKLVPVIGEVGAAAEQAGASVEEMGGFFSAFTQTAGSTPQAATQARAVMMALVKPTETMTRAIKAWGYESGRAMVEDQGLVETIRKLAASAKKSHVELGKLFESSEALTALGPALADNFSRIISYIEEMENRAGTTDKAFQEWQKTFRAIKETFDSTIKAFSIELGEELAPQIMRGMNDFSTWARDNKDDIIHAFEDIGDAVRLVVEELGWVINKAAAMDRWLEKNQNERLKRLKKVNPEYFTGTTKEELNYLQQKADYDYQQAVKLARSMGRGKNDTIAPVGSTMRELRESGMAEAMRIYNEAMGETDVPVIGDGDEDGKKAANEAKRAAEELLRIREDLTRDLKKLRLDEYDYQVWTLHQEVDEVRKSDGYIMASAETRAEVEKQLQERLTLELGALAEQRAKKLADEIEKAAEEARRAIEARLNASRDLAELTGDMGSYHDASIDLLKQQLGVLEETNASAEERALVERQINQIIAERDLDRQALMMEGIARQAIGAHKELAQMYRDMPGDVWESFESSALSAFDAIVDGSKNAGEALKDFLDQFLQDLTHMLAEMALANLKDQVFQSLVGGGTGSGTGLFDQITGLFGSSSSHAPTSNGSWDTGGFNATSTSALNHGDYAANGDTAGGGFGGATGSSMFGGAMAGAGMGAAVGSAASGGSDTGAIVGGVAGAVGAAIGTAILPGIGTILGGVIGGLAGSLFGEEKKEEPVQVYALYSGTATNFAGGNVSAASYVVNSDGSITPQLGTPSEMKATRKEWNQKFDDMESAMDALFVDFDSDWRRTFTYFTGIVSDDLSEWAGFVSANVAARHAVGDLAVVIEHMRTAGESTVDTLIRLGDALALFQATFGVSGVNLEAMAGITDEVLLSFAQNIDGVGDSTEAAMAAMEEFNKQLTAIASAQYADMLADAVGGEEGLQSAAATYAAGTMDSIEQAEAAIEYATRKVAEGLAEATNMFPQFTGDMLSSTDAFWDAYAAAMKQAMPPSMFSWWAEMAEQVSALESAQEELTKLQNEDWSYDKELEYRQLLAEGRKAEAKQLAYLIDAEKELAEARASGASYADQIALIETQIVEMKELLAELNGESAISPYEHAIELLQNSIQAQIDALEEQASVAESVQGIIDSLLLDDDSTLTVDQRFKYAQQRYSDLYAEGQAGDASSMVNAASAARIMLDTARKSMTDRTEYKVLFTKTVSELGAFANTSFDELQYDELAAQTDILEAMYDAISQDMPDTGLLSDANNLLALTRSGDLAGIQGWMDATLAAQGDDIGSGYAELLLAADTALSEAGHGTSLSEEQRDALQYLADNAVPQDEWDGYIGAIVETQSEFADLLQESIDARREEADRLAVLQATEIEKQEELSSYFEGIADYLVKQSNVERYQKMITDMQSQASQVQNLAMVAALSGVPAAAVLQMQQLTALHGEIAELQQELSKWQNYSPDIQLAGGGVITGPTIATVGESGHEMVLPLDPFTQAMDRQTRKLASIERTLDALLTDIGDNTRATAFHTHDAAQTARRESLKGELGA